MADTPEIDVQEAQKRVQGGALLLDVREQNEYDEEHIPGAQLLPLSELMARFDELPKGSRDRRAVPERKTERPGHRLFAGAGLRRDEYGGRDFTVES